MAKATLSSRVTPSHLQAIGSVAAHWSALETAMLESMVKITGVHILEVTVMAGPAAFASWVDMLIVLCRELEDHKHKEDQLESLFKLLLKLQRLRNYIVHAVWLPQEKGTGIIGKIMNPGITSGKDKAKGFGIPKRGRDVLVTVHWTAPQMRKVSSLTEKGKLMLREICSQKKPTSLRERNALARKGQTNLRRIRAMLDSLPDPFQP